MMTLSAVGAAILIAVGSNFVVPVGTAVGGLFDLGGIALLVMFLGLVDGESVKSDE